jgi:hypothetical protein
MEKEAAVAGAGRWARGSRRRRERGGTGGKRRKGGGETEALPT